MRYLRCITSLVVFSTVLCIPSISISGDSAVGTITALHGPVTVKRPGRSEPVKSALGDGIAVGDVVATGDGGRAQIALTDETFANLAGNASLRINQYSFDEQVNRRKAVVRVLSGRIRFVVFLVRSPGSGFRVETDTASIFVDDRCDIVVDASPALTSVAVLEETVRVRSASSYVIGEARLGVNQSVMVSGKKPPAATGLVSPAERRQYLREMSK